MLSLLLGAMLAGCWQPCGLCYSHELIDGEKILNRALLSNRQSIGHVGQPGKRESLPQGGEPLCPATWGYIHQRSEPILDLLSGEVGQRNRPQRLGHVTGMQLDVFEAAWRQVPLRVDVLCHSISHRWRRGGCVRAVSLAFMAECVSQRLIPGMESFLAGLAICSPPSCDPSLDPACALSLACAPG